MQNQNQKSLSCCILLKSQVSWRKTLWPAISMIMTPSTELSKVGKVESKIMKNADPCKIVTVIGRKKFETSVLECTTTAGIPGVSESITTDICSIRINRTIVTISHEHPIMLLGLG